MNQQDFDFDLETPKQNAFISKSRDFFKRSAQYVAENPGDIIMFAVGIMLLDIDTTLEQIEEHEEIQTAYDIWAYKTQTGA